MRRYSFFHSRCGDVGRHSRSLRFTLRHAFCQPLEPLPPCVAMIALPLIGRVRQQFPPRNQNRAAEEIIDDVQRQFTVKKQHPNRFPRGSEMHEQIFASVPRSCRISSALALSGNSTTRRSALENVGLWNERTSSSIASRRRRRR